MTGDTGLPPGQYEIDEFPRFGLAHFAGSFPKETRQIQLMLTGDVEEATTVSNELRDLPRVDQTSDFHCVTTWTRRALHLERLSIRGLLQTNFRAPGPAAAGRHVRGS